MKPRVTFAVMAAVLRYWTPFLPVKGKKIRLHPDLFLLIPRQGQKIWWPGRKWYRDCAVARRRFLRSIKKCFGCAKEAAPIRRSPKPWPLLRERWHPNIIARRQSSKNV